MSEIIVREKSGGGLTITAFPSGQGISSPYLMDSTDLDGLNIDKCKLDSSGKVYEDSSIETEEEKNQKVKDGASTKLTILGFTKEEIELIL